jgi:hypothetical protein
MVAALLLAVGLVGVAASPASATSIDAQCAGSFSRSFTPPVTATPQSVTVTGTTTYGPCVVGPTAVGTETATSTLSCVNLLPGISPFSETITWLDGTGDTTTILWSNATAAGQTVVYTGVVTAGRHLGDTATKTTSGVSYLGSVLPCLLGTPIATTNGLVDNLLLVH